MKRLCLALALVLLVAATSSASAGPSASAAFVKSCNTRADFNILITSVRNMSCRKARRAIRRYRGSISYRFKTPGGFSCRRVSGSRLSGGWRCKKCSKAFRFQFGD